LRQATVATLAERLAASGIATRYYTPEVHLASFALPRFILDIVERGREG
jgi:spermidine synthase